MSRTRRSVRYPAGSGRTFEQIQPEQSRWLADRNDRIGKAKRDEHRIARAEEFTARRDLEPRWAIGTAVRAVA
ncbi:hypothetical protein QN355_06460 [Cryobacterium sp. 10S3]|uniref:hypothetical protein n=1 Tax=Cryobacterium sp. 10S3 TaxID=3048582 RepID=UPI002AC99AC6|nr:hypothetical protein [Cryobacterium sp. 10S3]MEB0286191.1 hypothetical protein [Cryobacterium sp. 10S3]WPX12249.1 hypothetical protein RHM57_11200 [Cryobacterium sp. 10S3]